MSEKKETEPTQEFTKMMRDGCPMCGYQHIRESTADIYGPDRDFLDFPVAVCSKCEYMEDKFPTRIEHEERRLRRKGQ